MEITHNIKTSAQNVTASTPGFDISINCNAYMLDNNGPDDVKVYFNGDGVNYALIKANAAIPIGIDNIDELINDTLKIEFVTVVAPMLNIIKQTKNLIV